MSGNIVFSDILFYLRKGRMKGRKKLSESAASGMVALVFLILGFQLALFVTKVLQRPAKVGAIVAEAGGASPDAVVMEPGSFKADVKKSGRNKGAGTSVPAPKRRIESFRFDPNTVSEEDLVRLGLSPKQAASIGNYRSKGGCFRKKEDFAKMYVVSDTLYARLEPYIDIPKLELNSADSAALVRLKGIGPFYARRIISYRERLGGFSDIRQMMEMEGLDSVRFSGFRDDISVDTARIVKIDIWRDSVALLARHPYIGEKGARRIGRFRTVYDSTHWSTDNLLKEHIFDEEQISRLRVYLK
ncbi:MAG: helix-hairpin-helix domain-containing protein [Bacteroidales bacterium]|nr:helix-hairpin-helix domain-containing protein [Candidatus Cacconaster scatequi]